MTKINRVDKLAHYSMTLSEEIRSLKTKDVANVRNLYGDIGVDIFEGKKPTILSKKEKVVSKTFLYKIYKWITGYGYYDYEEGDRLKDVVFKYVGNEKSGLIEDVTKNFGKRGKEEFDKLHRLGYVEV